MKAMAFGLTSCSSSLVPKSKLLHKPEAQYGFVTKLSLHGGKNIALRAEKPFFAVLRFSERRVKLAPTIPSVNRLDRRSTFLVEHSGTGFLLTKYVMALQETKIQGGYFIRELAHEEKYPP